MLEKYESFSTREKEEFRDICNELFDKTFLNEEVISNNGGFVINEKFNFVRRNFELFEEYFRNLRCIKDMNIIPNKIYIKDILYIEAINKRTKLHMTNGRIINSPYTLKHWISELTNSGFCQPHKSFFINLSYVNEITNTDVILYSDELIPLSRNHKKSFEKDLLDFLYKAI